MDHQEARLKKAVRDQATAVDTLAPDSAGYARAVAELGKATDALLDHARKVPELRREAKARARRLRVRVLGAVQTAAVVAAGVYALVGATSLGWLVLLVPALAIGLWHLAAPPQGSHQIAVAVLCTLASVGAALVAFHVVSGWWTVLVLVFWIFTAGAADEGRTK